MKAARLKEAADLAARLPGLVSNRARKPGSGARATCAPALVHPGRA